MTDADHEAGHAFMMICLGARVRSVSIEPDRDDGPQRHADTMVAWPPGENCVVESNGFLPPVLRDHDVSTPEAIATCSQHGVSVFEFLVQSIEAHFGDLPGPSLLSAPS